jgi:lysozyme
MNRKTWLSAAVLALIASGASAPVILDQFIKEKESSGQYHLQAYLDGAKVWTICDGRTQGVHAGLTMTRQQCDEWRKTEIAKRIAFSRSVIKVPMSEPAWAGFGSFCFNIGNAGCASSSSAKLINSGKQAEGCRAMLKWRYITRDGVKIDCSKPQPYCSGLWDRRNAEAELCAS